jgi:threonine dehydratase
VYLKCESFQRGGAFKFRGALHAISRLTDEEKKRGVIAASSGNHAQAVALAARIHGTVPVLLVPADAAEVKVEAVHSYGGRTIFYDRFHDDRDTLAKNLAHERGLTIIPPYDHPHVMAGAGTVALEMLEEVPDLDAIVTPVGGGGLISGTACAAQGIRPSIRIFGVEPEGAEDTLKSIRSGKRVQISPPDTIADGLRATRPGLLTFPIIQKRVENIFTTRDSEIVEAIRFCLFRLKLVIEPSGAIALAAIMKNRLPSNVKRVGVILSGGNIDPGCLRSILESSLD